MISDIFEFFHPNILFDWTDVIKLLESAPNLIKNSHIRNNQGALMGTGQKLYKRAKRVIPGGNMLLSKRPEMFLPENWPAYFS